MKESTEKQLGAPASEVGNYTRSSLEKAVSPVCRVKIKVWATMVASGEMNLTNYKKWLKAIESELKSTIAPTDSDVAVDRSVLNISQNVTNTTRLAFKENSDRSSKARRAVLGWRQTQHGIDCGITFVCRFDFLLVIAFAKKVNIPDVQNVLLLSWILGRNELKSTIHFVQ